MSNIPRSREKMARFQGSLEYLIVLGAAVLIAGVVVAYMFGFLGSSTRQNMVNKCAKFRIMLCQYATQFSSLGYSTPADAMASYLSATLYEYTSNGFTRVNCTVSDPNTATCDTITFTYDPQQNTITPSEDIYIDTRLRVYFGQKSSYNDYLCVPANQAFKCS